MSRFNRNQYLALTEILGEAVAEVNKSNSEVLTATALKVVGIVADGLKFDNPNFNQKQFIEGVKATAELERLI